MVLKRIISCLAMVSVVLLLSCYDVNYKDSTTADSKEWTDGLTPQQVMEGMEINGSMSSSEVVSKADDATVVEKDIEVSWEWPVDLEEPVWEVFYTFDDEATEQPVYGPALSIPSDSNKASSLGSIYSTTAEDGATMLLKIAFKVKWTAYQKLLQVKIKMRDSNNDVYLNVVTFLVAPNDMTCTIRPDKSEAAASSTIYTTQLCALQGLAFLLNPSDSSYLYQEKNRINDYPTPLSWKLEKNKTIFFGIETDFISRGLGIVRHQSSSSYCKVRKVATTDGASATFRYTFEDLPKEQLRFENGKKFDYDDVIFLVDLK